MMVDTTPTSRTGRDHRAGGVVTDDLLAWSDHCELRHRGRTLGVVGFSDLLGWFSAVVESDGWRTLDRSASEAQARQRVHAEVGRGRWRRVDSLHGTSW